MRRRTLGYLGLAMLLFAGGMGCGGGGQSGPSVQCRSDSDCSDDQRCRSGLCLPACREDSDCKGASEVCKFGGVCVTECPDGSGCGKDEVCHTKTRTCWPEGVDVQACELDQDCDPGHYCSKGTCAPSGCSADKDCRGHNICDRGRCRTGCRSDGPDRLSCPEGDVCSTDTNICKTEGCRTGKCDAFKRCDKSRDPAKCVYTGECGGSDSTCQAYAAEKGFEVPYVCDEEQGKCVKKEACDEDTDCADDEICLKREGKRNKCREGCRCTDDCDRACPPGRVCSAEQGKRCVKGCTTDAECKQSDDGDYCVDLQCREGCTTADDCTLSDGTEGRLTCRASGDEPRICRPCTQDSHCKAREFCNFKLGRTSAEKKDQNVGLCDDIPPACPKDKFGKNHDRGGAYEIQSFPFSATPKFCRNKPKGEWFKLSAGTDKVIDIELSYDQAVGNLDVLLLDSRAKRLVASDAPPQRDKGTERIVYGVPGQATFLVRVEGAIRKKNTEYSLKINVRDPKSCSDKDDMQEENDEAGKATKLPDGTDHQGLFVCGDDADYYELEAKQNQNLEITASAPDRLGDISLFLYNQSGGTLASSTNGEDGETITYSTRNPQTLILEVRVQPVGRVEYNLRWTQTPNACADRYEPNDSCPAKVSSIDRSQLTGSGGKTLNKLAVCKDDDFYSVKLLPKDKLKVEAAYDLAKAQGSLQLTIFGPNSCNRLVPGGTATEKNIKNSSRTRLVADHEAKFGGKFYIAVNQFRGVADIPYTLSASVKAGPTCNDDGSEPNDSQSKATMLSRSDIQKGRGDSALLKRRVCDVNSDWYCTQLKKNDKVEWQVQFDHSNGDIDAFLVAPNGKTKDRGDSTSDDENVTHKAGSDGKYCLKVAGKQPVRNDYRVLTWINGKGPSDPQCPDRYENNDSCSSPGASCQATSLTAGNYTSLLSCGRPTDADWYKTEVQPGEELKVETTNPNSKGALTLRLYAASDLTSPVDRSAAFKKTQSVSAGPSPRQQTFYYRVDASPGVTAEPYEMKVDVSQGPSCTEDPNEENDSPSTATAVASPGIQLAQKKCESDADWYETSLKSGEKFKAIVNHDSKRANLDLELYEKSGSNPLTVNKVAESKTSNDQEALTFDPASDGTYWLKIVPRVPARISYDLLTYRDLDGNDSFDTPREGTPDTVCPDAFENNDKWQQSAGLNYRKYDRLLMCSRGFNSDDDWYRVRVPSGAKVKASATFDHGAGNLDMELYRADGQGSAVARSNSSSKGNGVEKVTATNNQQSEQYYVRVFARRGTFRNMYSLDIGLNFGGMCPEDQFKGNNTDKKSAAALSARDYDGMTGLMLCEQKEDWFKFDTGSSGRATFVLDHRKSMGEIAVELRDGNGKTVAPTTTRFGGNVKIVSSSKLSKQTTYYLRVHPKGQTVVRNPYDLWASFGGNNPSQPRCEDPFERNDQADVDLAQPVDLSKQSQFDEPLACGDDEDWYRVNLKGNETYSFETYFFHQSSTDIATELRDPNGNVVSDPNGKKISFANDSSSKDEFATFKPGSNGTYLFGVKMQSSRLRPYRLQIDRSGMCAEDTYDKKQPENDTEFNSATISLNSSNVQFPAGLCGSASELDFFDFKARKAGRLQVVVYYNPSRVDLAGKVTHRRSGRAVRMTKRGNRLIYDSSNQPVSIQKGDKLTVKLGLAGTKTGPYFLRIKN